LSKFNPKTGEFTNFDKSDGLQNNEFNSAACYKTSDGEMLFGGINGFNIFHPENISKNSVIPSVVFSDLKIINKKVYFGDQSPLEKSIVTSNEINLSYHDYIFSIEFAALSFISPHKNKYAYKLEGFDKDWISTDYKNRLATYTNLEGGTYIFRVKASNNDGVWNENGASIIINITPPVWKSWWFRILLFLIVFISAIIFYRLRINAIKTQKDFLEKTVREKTREVVAQKSELEAINEELSASNHELQNQREELKSTLQILQNAQLQIVQSEKMASLGILAAGVAHEINNPLNFIQGGIEGLEMYFQQNLKDHLPEVNTFINGIQVGLERAASIVTSMSHYSRNDTKGKSDCNIQTIIENCLVILQNQIKNRIAVFKDFCPEPLIVHGNDGKLHQAMLNILANSVQAINDEGNIKITTWKENKKIIITVEDNGCGISSENLTKIFDPFFTTKEPGKGTGLGLAITYTIIKEHQGTIEFDSKPGTGTTIKITLPHAEKIL
jgi:signal transduction histidine kinase